MREIIVNKTDENKSSIATTRRHTAEDVPLKKLLSSNDLHVSIEICANRNLDEITLSSIPRRFCSVTWRTPSSKELRNVDTIPAIVLAKRLRCHGCTVLLHLAGRNLKRYQVAKILTAVKDAGIRNILALQGDASEIEEDKGDFPYAVDLVKFIRSYYGNVFTIAVACYPQKHPTAETMEKDLYHLRQKVRSGVDLIITQLCFDHETFASFRNRCRSSGIEIPIIPGVFIINSYQTLMAMSTLSGVPVPKNIWKIVQTLENNREAIEAFGIHQATEMMANFFRNGDFMLHVFTLNRLKPLEIIFDRFGICIRCIERPIYTKRES